MEVFEIPIERINVPKRLRPLDPAAVDRLAASIKEIGLKSPISVRLAKRATSEQGKDILNEPLLVAGRHRLEALLKLGRRYAPCIEVRDDDLLAELWEIDENLVRSELSPAQTAAHLKRRKEIWESLNSGQNSATTRGPGMPVGFAGDTATKTGMAKSTINQQLARAEALGDDLQRVTGTSLDKGVELDALAKAAPAQRSALIERAANGEKVSARDIGLADYALSESKAEKIEWSRLRGAWNQARVAIREQLLDEIGVDYTSENTDVIP